MFQRHYVLLLAMTIASASIAHVNAQAITECEKRIDHLKLTKTEQDFIKTIEEEHQGFVESLVVFWGLAEIGDAPKTASDLAEALATRTVAAQVPDDTAALFAKGLKKISLKPVYDQVVLFRIGKHQNYDGYRPKGDSHRFFTCLLKALERKLAS